MLKERQLFRVNVLPLNVYQNKEITMVVSLTFCPHELKITVWLNLINNHRKESILNRQASDLSLVDFYDKPKPTRDKVVLSPDGQYWRKLFINLIQSCHINYKCIFQGEFTTVKFFFLYWSLIITRIVYPVLETFIYLISWTRKDGVMHCKSRCKNW